MSNTAEDFVWPIRVYYEDTDAGGVVFYANYLRFMERARTEWLRSLGFEQDALMRDPGVLFAVRRTEVDYLTPGRFNDLLKVSSRVVQLRGATLTFEQRIVSDDDAQRELCRGRVTVACLDSDSMRPTRIPSAIREKIPATE